MWSTGCGSLRYPPSSKVAVMSPTYQWTPKQCEILGCAAHHDDGCAIQGPDEIAAARGLVDAGFGEATAAKFVVNEAGRAVLRDVTAHALTEVAHYLGDANKVSDPIVA